MDTIEIKCNFKKCRKSLRDYAWVTSCSHIFCNEDGSREFQKERTCPACSTKLPGKLDVTRMELNPSEQYKSMALTGLSPDIIMDISTRALSFWNYQCHNELAYKTIVEQKGKERCSKLEQLYEQAASKFKNELKTSREELEVSRSDTEKQRQRCSELSEILIEKTRQLQKVQAMYENMRRKCTSPEYLGQARISSTEKEMPRTVNHDFAFNFSRREETQACGGHAMGGFSEYNLNTMQESIPEQFRISIAAKSNEVGLATLTNEEFPAHMQRPPYGCEPCPGGFDFMNPRIFNN